MEYNWPEPSKSLNRLPHPRSCHHFIHTKHDGSHVIKRCHGDKVFDYRSLRCQHKSSAKCWKDIVKKGISFYFAFFTFASLFLTCLKSCESQGRNISPTNILLQLDTHTSPNKRSGLIFIREQRIRVT